MNKKKNKQKHCKSCGFILKSKSEIMAESNRSFLSKLWEVYVNCGGERCVCGRYKGYSIEF